MSVVEEQQQQWDENYHVLDFPLEIQNHIFHFFSAKELYSTVDLVCNEWHDLALQEMQWKRLCKQDYGFLVSKFELKKPRMLSWRLWWKFLALDGLLFLKDFSAPLLKLARKQRSYVVRCRKDEHIHTFPFPPPHKIARGQLSLKEGEYNYFEVYIASVAGDKNKDKEETAEKSIQQAEVGVGIATAKAKVNEFLGQNNYGGGYYNNACIGCSGKFTPALRPKKDDEIEDEEEGEEEIEEMEERREEETASAAEEEPSASSGERKEEELINASTFGAGDIVGVLVDLKTPKRRMGFFINGDFQGFHYSNLPADTAFYPAVSLKSYGSKVIAHPLLTHSTTFSIDGEDADHLE